MKKKIIFIAFLTILMLVGCSHINENKKEKSEESTTTKTLKTIVKQTKEIRESNELEKFKDIAYKDSPYYEYINYLIKNKNSSDVNRNIEFSHIKFVKGEGDIKVVYVTEHLTSKGAAPDYDVETNYYYFFKKENKEWRIYDYLPSTAVNNLDDLIKQYQ